jgi:hypothetical protein
MFGLIPLYSAGKPSRIFSPMRWAFCQNQSCSCRNLCLESVKFHSRFPRHQPYPRTIRRPSRAHRARIDVPVVLKPTYQFPSLIWSEPRIKCLVLVVDSMVMPVIWDGPFCVPSHSRIVSLGSSRSAEEPILVAPAYFLAMVFGVVVRVPT